MRLAEPKETHPAAGLSASCRFLEEIAMNAITNARQAPQGTARCPTGTIPVGAIPAGKIPAGATSAGTIRAGAMLRLPSWILVVGLFAAVLLASTVQAQIVPSALEAVRQKQRLHLAYAQRHVNSQERQGGNAVAAWQETDSALDLFGGAQWYSWYFGAAWHQEDFVRVNGQNDQERRLRQQYVLVSWRADGVFSRRRDSINFGYVNGAASHRREYEVDAENLTYEQGLVTAQNQFGLFYRRRRTGVGAFYGNQRITFDWKDERGDDRSLSLHVPLQTVVGETIFNLGRSTEFQARASYRATSLAEDDQADWLGSSEIDQTYQLALALSKTGRLRLSARFINHSYNLDGVSEFVRDRRILRLGFMPSGQFEVAISQEDTNDAEVLTRGDDRLNLENGIQVNRLTFTWFFKTQAQLAREELARRL